MCHSLNGAALIILFFFFFFCILKYLHYCRNRIALLQKEEERARKKIDQTKDRANEILAMRDENERRMEAFVSASNEEKALQRELQERNKQNEIETKQALAMQSQKILARRKEDAHLLNLEKRNMTKMLIREQESELRLKQKKREEIRNLEEQIRMKRDMEKQENERRIREQYEKRAAAEESEARRAEKLVRALEQKEKEWMSKLAEAQTIQEAAFGHLEYSLLRDNHGGDNGSSIASPASEMMTDATGQRGAPLLPKVVGPKAGGTPARTMSGGSAGSGSGRKKTSKKI
jgi:septal ring factor EnvC (AmiA/AmiB activator)